MKETYTTALLELLTPDADVSSVLAGFRAALKQRGHDALYRPVLERVLRTLRSARPQTTVTVARTADMDTHATAIAAALAALGASETTTPEIVVDETLIGGFIAEHAHARQNTSYKSKLISLYREITK